MAGAEDVRKLAALARIGIPEEALALRAEEFENIIAYIGQLEELVTDAGTDATPKAPDVRNVMREDVDPTPAGTWTEKLTAQFPEHEGDYLAVKKVISYD